MAVFFGLLHQGGTIPAMLDVHRQLSHLASAQGSTAVQLLFWRSFMPPRHLILPTFKGLSEVLVDDCQSMPVALLAKKMAESAANVIVFLPSWSRTKEAMDVLHHHGLSLTPVTPSFLHIDTDHLAESIAAYHQGQSLWQSFSYAAYSVR
jgi:phosphatidylinositol glycan class Z